MAEAFPNSCFHGLDPHEDSITAARENAQSAGVEERVHFAVGTAKTFIERGLDLICFFDCLQDMGDPVGAARHVREVMTKSGTVMAVEPLGRDNVEDNIIPVSRIHYSASTMLCCAHSLSEEVVLALGAQAGESQVTTGLLGGRLYPISQGKRESVQPNSRSEAVKRWQPHLANGNPLLARGRSPEHIASMPQHIQSPACIQVAGEPPKVIEEYIGRLASQTASLSVARMISPSGWNEPGQTPEFDELTVVLHGTLRVETRTSMQDVTAGQAVIAPKGEWVRYSTPGPEKTEYIAVCLPAFSPDAAHRGTR